MRRRPRSTPNRRDRDGRRRHHRFAAGGIQGVGGSGMRIGMERIQSRERIPRGSTCGGVFVFVVIALSLIRPSFAQTPGQGGSAPTPSTPSGSNPPAAAQPAPSGGVGGRNLTIIVPEEGE